MKLQLKLDQLSRLDISQAVRLLAANAKKVETTGEAVPILIFAEHQYPDPKFKGKMLPLVLIGDYDTAWKNEFNDRKAKDATTGECKVANGTVTIEVTAGKALKNDTLKEMTLLFRQARFQMEIKGKGDEAGGKVAGGTDTGSGESGGGGKKLDDLPKEQAAKIKDGVSKQVKALAELIDDFKECFGTISKRTIPNLKQGRAGKGDVVAVRRALDIITQFETIYNKTPKSLQKAFAEAKNNMDQQKKLLGGLGKEAKAKKVTLAKQLADAFYMKNKGRPADEGEEAMMQESLKAALDHHNISGRKGAERQLRLKAIYATAQFRGAYFSPEDTDKVYAAMEG